MALVLKGQFPYLFLFISNAETVAMNLDPRSIAHIFLTFLWLTKDFSKSKTGGFLRGRSESAVDILQAIENGHAKT